MYGTPERLQRRTEALHRAKVAGRPAQEVIADLAAASDIPPGAVVVDIGCGRGSTTRALAHRFRPGVLVALDRSAALLAATRDRLRGAGRVRLVCGDFHTLPLPDRAVDVAVAAFCLYHSPHPDIAIAEIGRCLAPEGVAVLATKSADSYRELDEVVAVSGLDPAALTRPSLYRAAHSANITQLATGTLDVLDVLHEDHQFRFDDLHHLAAYLSTSPKYALPPDLGGSPEALARALRERIPDGPVTTTSTVTYVVARRPALLRPCAAGDDVNRPAVTGSFVKRYADPDRAARAAANHRWLGGLGGPLRLPRLLRATPTTVEFAYVHGRSVLSSDLPAVAAHLGDVHGWAHVRELHRSRLDTPHPTGDGFELPDFVTPRLQPLHQRLRGGVPGALFDADQAVRLLQRAMGEPAALYKDANPRNFLITGGGIVTVDLDDLTLAPFGYDLAKLLVTLTMAHGPLPTGAAPCALAVYNRAADHHQPGLGHVTLPALLAWAEIHHALTWRYLGRRGYRHSWHTARDQRDHDAKPGGRRS